jgi:CubicO group peptidase (beta-lactamase class C family)
MAVAVVKDGKVVALRGYGYADAESRVPVTPDTLFEIGSITKQFTATIVMMLVEEGKVSLDEKARTYLPQLPEAWSGVTVRNLLNHTSGIPNYTAKPGFSWDHDFTPDEILKLASEPPVDFAPGERWEYSNTNYYLAGMIIEKLTGHALARELADRVFKPLGMAHTRLADEQPIIPNRARGYAWTDRLINAPLLHRGAADGAGAILSCANDMAKWAAALSAGTLLKPSSYRAMESPARLNDGSFTKYGFGWAIGIRNGHRLFDHSGGTGGFSTMISRYPDDNLIVVVLTNLAGNAAGPCADAYAAEYVPALARKALKPAAVDPDPAATAKIRAAVLNLLSGKPDMSIFTDDMRKVLTPEMLASVRGQITSMGPLNSFAFVSGSTNPVGHSYVYSATFGTTPLVIHATIEPGGKIAGLWAGPE